MDKQCDWFVIFVSLILPFIAVQYNSNIEDAIQNTTKIYIKIKCHGQK